LRLVTHTGGGSLKSQMKRADKSGALLALIMGEDEMQSGTVGVKYLRSADEQFHLSQVEMSGWLTKFVKDLNSGE
jgi:histidyl-tRNA synthetase